MLEKINANMMMLLEKQVEEPSTIQTVIMGIGTVFLGLLCIVILCKIIGAFCNAGKKSSDETVSQVANLAPATAPAQAVIENRGEIIAAISAVAAEELGTDVSAIRILSFKKL